MRIVALAVLPVLLAGCFNPAVRVDGRTALEQQLTRTAILRAVAKLPVHRSVLEGRWKIEVVSPAGEDDSWTRALVRQRLVGLGAEISTNAAEKLPVVQATLLFAGSDIDSFVVGIPLPGTAGTSSISFFHENVERGRARVRLNFWDAEGALVAQTPPSVGEAHYGDYFVLTFLGPFSFTDLDDVETYGRFREKGVDAWEGLTELDGPDQTDAVEQGDWIPPATKESP